MSYLTQWGYTLTAENALPPMLTVENFNTMTGGKYAGEPQARIEAELNAAGSAVRNYVGWHLYNETACLLRATLHDRRVTVVGPDLLIQLPARFVSAVESVTVNGVECEHFGCETNGTLRVYDVSFHGLKRYSPVVVEYTAGLPESMMDPIRELIAHRVTHAVAVPSGITSEASGGVSVTYNASWINSAQSTTLQDTNKELLMPYRVQGVF